MSDETNEKNICMYPDNIETNLDGIDTCPDGIDPDEYSDLESFEEAFCFALTEMARVYKMHKEKKGDSWKKMSSFDLHVLLAHEWNEYTKTIPDSPAEYHELTDLLNVGFMLLTRLAESKNNPL